MKIFFYYVIVIALAVEAIFFCGEGIKQQNPALIGTGFLFALVVCITLIYLRKMRIDNEEIYIVNMPNNTCEGCMMGYKLMHGKHYREAQDGTLLFVSDCKNDKSNSLSVAVVNKPPVACPFEPQTPILKKMEVSVFHLKEVRPHTEGRTDLYLRDGTHYTMVGNASFNTEEGTMIFHTYNKS